MESGSCCFSLFCSPPGASDFVGRAFNYYSRSIENMSVDHRCSDVRVTEQLLNGSDIVAGLQQMSGKRMAKRVNAYAGLQAGFLSSSFNRFLKSVFVDMMSAYLVRAFID